jgi:hypothetical protein
MNSEPKPLLKRSSTQGIEKRHKEQFVGWFERKVRNVLIFMKNQYCNCALFQIDQFFFCCMQAKELFEERKISEELYDLSQGPHYVAPVFNRCVIHDFFQTATIEAKYNTQNSGVVVKGGAEASEMDWYGVLNKVITLDFPGAKEVILFECHWFDVPTASTSKTRGYSKDQYGIIDIDTSRRRYMDEPYVLGTQVEQVFYVKCANKPTWCSVVRMKPRTLFSMSEEGETEQQGHGQIDINSADVGVENMDICSQIRELTNWTRNNLDRVSGDANIIETAIPMPEPDLDDIPDDDDENDDTYINDGHVAPVNTLGQGEEDELFR